MKHIVIVILTSIFFMACEEDSERIPDDNNGGNNEEWLIPSGEVFDGGPGKDGIPALSSPDFSKTSNGEHNYLSDNDLVLAVKFDNRIRAYPHPILDWHEIINDAMSDHEFAVNYCPLTGTGMAWNRVLNERPTTFGVSGLLYNTNLILYDRLTDSYWSQMELMSVKGEFAGQDAEIYSMVEMKWSTWKSIYPDEQVVNTPGSYNRPYGSYPYGDYKTNNNALLFPVNIDDDRIPQKERVFAVISDKENVKVYRFIGNPGENIFIEDNYMGTDYVIAGRGDDFLVAFIPETTDGISVSLKPADSELPVLLKDETGTEWDVFGKALNGVNQGKELKMAAFINGFWFTFPAFFESVKIFGGD